MKWLSLLVWGVVASAGLEDGVSSFRLSNGMTWIVASRPGDPNVTALTYADAGSAQETRGTTGVSMVLQRSAMRQAQAAGFDKARGIANQDRMILTATLPKADLEKWLTWEVERLRNPDLSAFEAERQTMLAEGEKRRGGGGFVLEEILGLAFLAHPYGQPPLGYASDMQRLRVADGKAHFDRYCVASNLIEVVVGDLPVEAVKGMAERYFNRLPKVAKPDELRTLEPVQRGERRMIIAPAAGAGVVITFHRPAVGDAMFPVWDVLSIALARGLKQDLMGKQKLVTRVMAHHGLAGMKYPGLMTVLAFASPGHECAEVETAALAQIERLRTAVLPEDEFAESKKGWPEGFDHLKSESLATELADWHAMTGDWRSLFRYPERARAVTREQVHKLAREALGIDRRTVGTCRAEQEPKPLINIDQR